MISGDQQTNCDSCIVAVVIQIEFEAANAFGSVANLHVHYVQKPASQHVPPG